MIYFIQNYNFPRAQRGPKNFQGGEDPTFSRGPNANVYKNPYHVIFQGGGPDSIFYP